MLYYIILYQKFILFPGCSGHDDTSLVFPPDFPMVERGGYSCEGHVNYPSVYKSLVFTADLQGPRL